MNTTNILADHGFELEPTGGGNNLLSLYLPHGAYVWVTTLEGGDVPTWSDWRVCVYPADWDGAQDTLLFDAFSDDSLFGLADAVAAALAAA